MSKIHSAIVINVIFIVWTAELPKNIIYMENNGKEPHDLYPLISPNLIIIVVFL